MPLDEACCKSGTVETVHLHGYIPRFEFNYAETSRLIHFRHQIKGFLAHRNVLFLKYDAAGYNPIKMAHYLTYRFTTQRMIRWLALLWFERVLHTSWLKERQGVPRKAAAQIRFSIGNND
ncbi:hypothetical protein IFM46972_06507 [Aspergillus udagawae]|uniref:Uncharacterized protein n=1 Tax=Aspergillus udagawae TaxID=91492 RepID=A0A8H3RXF6_9EURO|nr:hypothetical protein IFM46972_06507 [Aspergillus udagawae]